MLKFVKFREFQLYNIISVNFENVVENFLNTCNNVYNIHIYLLIAWYTTISIAFTINLKSSIMIRWCVSITIIQYKHTIELDFSISFVHPFFSPHSFAVWFIRSEFSIHDNNAKFLHFVSISIFPIRFSFIIGKCFLPSFSNARPK